MIPGLDISSCQGPLTQAQLQAVKDRGTRFVIAKCGNGNEAPDPDFQSNIFLAQEVGLIVGVYHFPFGLPPNANHPGRTPEDQAKMHFAQCGGLGAMTGTLPACCDGEYPRPEAWGKPIAGIDDSITDRNFLVDFFSRYLATYEAEQGCPMMFYSDPWFLGCLEPIPPAWARNPLWEAAYSPTVPARAPWSGWSVRQTSGGGGLLPGGIPVDTDVIADEATLARLLAR